VTVRSVSAGGGRLAAGDRRQRLDALDHQLDEIAQALAVDAIDRPADRQHDVVAVGHQPERGALGAGPEQVGLHQRPQGRLGLVGRQGGDGASHTTRVSVV